MHLILILYPGRRIEEWVESNLPSLTAPRSSWVGLRLENSNLNLASQRPTQPPAVSSFSAQQPSHSESSVRAGWLTGQLSRGTFCQREKGAHSYQHGDARGITGPTHTHAHTRARAKHEARRGGRRVGRGWGNLHQEQSAGAPGFGPTCRPVQHPPPQYFCLE